MFHDKEKQDTGEHPFIEKYGVKGVICSTSVGQRWEECATLKYSVTTECSDIQMINDVVAEAIEAANHRYAELGEGGSYRELLRKDEKACPSIVSLVIDASRQDHLKIAVLPSGYSLVDGCNIEYVENPEIAEEIAEIMLASKSAIEKGLNKRGIQIYYEPPSHL